MNNDNFLFFQVFPPYNSFLNYILKWFSWEHLYTTFSSFFFLIYKYIKEQKTWQSLLKKIVDCIYEKDWKINKMKILNMLLEYSSCFSALLFKHSQKFYLCFKYELFAYKILTKKKTKHFVLSLYKRNYLQFIIISWGYFLQTFRSEVV